MELQSSISQVKAFFRKPFWSDWRTISVVYALKALPVTLIWLKLCFEMYTKDYAAKSIR